MEPSPNRKYTLIEAGIRIRQGEYIPGADGFHPNTVSRYIRAGLLDSLRVGGTRWITERQIRDFERRLANGEAANVRTTSISNIQEGS